MSPGGTRIVITIDKDGVIRHCGTPARVVMRRGSIAVGCTDVSIEAALALLTMHQTRFPPFEDAQVVQEGAAA